MTLIETPLTRVLGSGFAAAATADLLTVGLSNDDHLDDSAVRAQQFLRSIGSLDGLGELSREHLKAFAGCDDVLAARFLAWIELGRRAAQVAKGDLDLIGSPDDVARILRHLRHEKKEHFVVLLLDTQNQLIKWTTIHIGTLNMSIVGPREVFREAVREGAASIIVAHNHPSGSLEPSAEDLDVTKKLIEIGELLDIVVWDHIILGGRNQVSLRQMGYFGRT